MDHFDKLLEGMVKKSYVNQGLQNEKARQNQLQILLNQKKLPVAGWNDQAIELAIHELSIMDSNNFTSNAGVGEREGRIYSSLVARRHYNLSHGIGRSGDISEVQPKAAGSSIIYKLTNSLVLHAMEIAGLKPGMTSLVLPLATGMSLTMCFIAMKASKPNAKYIIWPRIDQKSCFKSIATARLTPLCVENKLVNGQMITDVAAIAALMEQYGDQVLCVLSTTSCFAPRQPDLVDEIAVLCKQHHCGHVINNAYGVQCEVICKKINRAITIGRVDAGNSCHYVLTRSSVQTYVLYVATSATAANSVCSSAELVVVRCNAL
jgi:O-phospho-L-seryl-tRNASec:L-selenocysteinyl-tRNA synthase